MERGILLYNTTAFKKLNNADDDEFFMESPFVRIFQDDSERIYRVIN